jgi:hypothetical protein
MIPLFTPATARKDVNKTPGDGELAKLANLNRLVENVNTIVAQGLPSAAPTFTYSNTGTLDGMSVNFNISVPSESTYNSGGTKTIQSYYSASIYINDDLGFNQSLTSITFSDIEAVNFLDIKYIPLLTSISFPITTPIYEVRLEDLFDLTNLNLPLLSPNLYNFQIFHLPSLTSFNFSNLVLVSGIIVIVDAGITSINFSSLKNVADSISFVGTSLEIRQCADLTTVNIPELVSFGSGIEIKYNPNLTSLTLGTIGILKSIQQNITFEGNALDEASVNGILALLVSLDGTNGTTSFQSDVQLTGGTNAAPTGQGLIDKQTLIDRGCNVYTN